MEWVASVTHSGDTRVSGDLADLRHEVYLAKELLLWSSDLYEHSFDRSFYDS
jgi:hypothetical protein